MTRATQSAVIGCFAKKGIGPAYIFPRTSSPRSACPSSRTIRCRRITRTFPPTGSCVHISTAMPPISASSRSSACGRWSVSLSGGGEEIFDHLIVCSGHHREPYIPQHAGEFAGEVLHSRDFKRAERFRDRRVLVIGGGRGISP